MDSIYMEMQGFDDILRYFRSDVVQKAVIRTTKEEGRRFVTGTVKDVRKEYNIKASELKKHIEIKNGDRYDLSTTIDIKSNMLPLGMFAPTIREIRTSRGIRRGVSVKVKKTDRRKIVKGGFLFGSNIYMRENEARYPLAVTSTLSIPQMFNTDIIDNGQKKFNESYPKTFAHNLNYYLSKS